MKPSKLILSVGILTLTAFNASAQDTNAITVDRIAICTAVVDREPQGEATEFDTTVESLFCFTELNGAEGKITHAWYQGDSVRAQIDLNKGRAGRWRTWSNKQMSPEWQGAWRVDVLDENGNVLKSASFTFGKSENAEKQ